MKTVGRVLRCKDGRSYREISGNVVWIGLGVTDKAVGKEHTPESDPNTTVL
jgi:hypothetical protein